MVEPGKEVGHDTETSLVMPMGVSLSELSSIVTRSRLWQVRCVAGEQLEAPSSSYKQRLPAWSNGSSVVS